MFRLSTKMGPISNRVGSPATDYKIRKISCIGSVQESSFKAAREASHCARKNSRIGFYPSGDLLDSSILFWQGLLLMDEKTVQTNE
jgi:hypothetical protein